MNRDEKESLCCLFILISLLSFAVGMFIGVAAGERLKNKSDRMIASDMERLNP